MKAKKAENTTFGTKAHKSVMPTHWAAESSGVKKSTLSPSKKVASKVKSMAKRKVTKK